MGRKRGPYEADFPVGEIVQIGSKEVLENFLRPNWQYHHPLDPSQLAYAGKIAVVQDVGFYHGGDELYHLEDIPGIWHEECLAIVSNRSAT